MVDLVRVDAMKIDLEASNQIMYGLKAPLVDTITVWDEKIYQALFDNSIWPWPLILVVDYANMSCRTTFFTY